MFKGAVPELSWQEKRQALLNAQQNCFEVGLTSVVDAGLDYETIQLIDSMHREETLKMQLDVMLTPNEENINRYVQRGPYKQSGCMCTLSSFMPTAPWVRAEHACWIPTAMTRKIMACWLSPSSIIMT
ncbi:MAG: hypothetical protein U5L09_00525 [Bacteroidales bacterium]|nr:hypothetical protein [Bacteroidales bacterium]